MGYSIYWIYYDSRRWPSFRYAYDILIYLYFFTLTVFENYLFYLILQLIYVDMTHKVFDVIYFILFCNVDVNLTWKHLKITNFIV